MPNKDECLNAIDVIARYCTEVKQGHVPPRFELTNELDVLMQVVEEHFDNTLDFKHFKLHSKSYLNTFKKEELIDYIYMVYHNWQGTDSACNHGMKYAEKLQKINDELQRVVDELNSKLTRKQNLVDSQKRYIQDLEESLKEYED